MNKTATRIVTCTYEVPDPIAIHLSEQTNRQKTLFKLTQRQPRGRCCALCFALA